MNERLRISPDNLIIVLDGRVLVRGRLVFENKQGEDPILEYKTRNKNSVITAIWAKLVRAKTKTIQNITLMSNTDF